MSEAQDSQEKKATSPDGDNENAHQAPGPGKADVNSSERANLKANKSDQSPKDAHRLKLAPENDSSLVASKGKRGYWEKVPPPHHRRKIQARLRASDDPEDPEAERDQRWYAGYTVRDDLPVNPWTYGLYARLTRFRPSIEENDMSLIQVFVGNNDPSHQFQSLEAGWKRQDHGEPELFIFFTTNNYGDRDWGVGGYVSSENNMGYVYLDKEPGVAFRPGKTFFSSSHIASGPQLVTELQWHLVKNRVGVADGWYLYVNGRWNGYFPLRFFERNVSDKTRTLSHFANVADFYGEVKDNDYDRSKPDEEPNPQKRTTTDMGSGRWPMEGFARSAHIENIQRLISPPGAQDHWEHASDRTWKSYAELGKPAADPSMYGIIFVPESNSEHGSHAFIGGPGFPLAVGQWDEWEDISDNSGNRGPRFDALACICVPDRKPNWTDAFMIGRDGIVYGSWQTGERDWSGFNSKDEWARLFFGEEETPKLDPKGKLAVVARLRESLDIFAVAKDGKVYTVSWAIGVGWKPWRSISGQNDRRFPSGAPITAISRHDKQLDLFINAGSGIFTSWWTESSDPNKPAEWAEWVMMNPGTANIPASAELLVLTRQAGALTVVATAQDGHVYASSWLQGLEWSGFGDIGVSAPDVSVDPPRASRFAPGGKVTGIVGGQDRLDLFAVSSDRSLYTCTWTSTDGWSGVGEDKYWTSLGYGTNDANAKIFSSITSDVVAVKRLVLGNVDVFVTGTGGQVYRTHWDKSSDRWTTGLGAIGWDEHVGSDREVVHDRGFRIGAMSRNPSSLTVVSITTAGTAIATNMRDD